MNFEDLQKTWQQNTAMSAASVDATRLAEVRRDSRTFSRKIMWRDAREVGASVLVSMVWAYMAYSAEAEGATAWPLWVAALLPLLVAAYFIIDRIIMRRRTAPQGETVGAEIERAAQDVRHQVWLLRNVLWWYLLPLAASSVMLAVQFIFYGPGDMPMLAKWIIGALVVLPTVFLDRYIWNLNQKAVRETLLPRLAELEQRRDELLNVNSTDE